MVKMASWIKTGLVICCILGPATEAGSRAVFNEGKKPFFAKKSLKLFKNLDLPIGRLYLISWFAQSNLVQWSESCKSFTKRSAIKYLVVL